MSFRLKTILGIVLIQATLLLILNWYGFNALKTSNSDELIKRAETTASQFVSTISDAILLSDLAALKSYVEEILKNPDILYAKIVVQNVVLAEAGDPATLVKGSVIDNSFEDVTDDVFDTSLDITIGAEKYGRVELGFSTKQIADTLKTTQKKLFAFDALAMVLLTIFSYLLGMYLTRGLETLKKASRQVAAGNLGYQIAVQGTDELAQATVAFNEMSSKLARLDMQRRRTEQELNESRELALSATKSKSQFLANMSHEIRTPLTSIIGFAETLLDSQSGEGEKTESIYTIIRNGRHLLTLINDILDLSKIESDNVTLEVMTVQPLTLLREIELLAGGLAREKGLMYTTDITFPIPRSIQTDPTRIKQILLNLVNNAVKFTEQGQIRIHCRFDQRSRRLYFEVHDSGIGMSAEELAKLFQPFVQANASTTRKYGGTGLGLNISKRLVILLGGEMSVGSAEGKGTCFQFYVPTNAEQNDEFIHSVEAIPHNSSTEIVTDIPALTGHVLIAEDSPDIRRLVSMYVRKAGVVASVAENGQIAVELALSNHFDLVLMDMQMPILDGLEATKRLRNAGYNKPIVALTANAMMEDRERYRIAGADDFLSKPVSQPAFYAMLRTYLKPATTSSNAAPSDVNFQDLVRRFVARLPKMRDEINQALAKGDLKVVNSVAHKLKGLGGSFGFPEITRVAADVEQLSEGHSSDLRSDLADDLARRVEELCKLCIELEVHGRH